MLNCLIGDELFDDLLLRGRVPSYGQGVMAVSTIRRSDDSEKIIDSAVRILSLTKSTAVSNGGRRISVIGVFGDAVEVYFGLFDTKNALSRPLGQGIYTLPLRVGGKNQLFFGSAPRYIYLGAEPKEGLFGLIKA